MVPELNRRGLIGHEHELLPWVRRKLGSAGTLLREFISCFSCESNRCLHGFTSLCTRPYRASVNLTRHMRGSSCAHNSSSSAAHKSTQRTRKVFDGASSPRENLVSAQVSCAKTRDQTTTVPRIWKLAWEQRTFSLPSLSLFCSSPNTSLSSPSPKVLGSILHLQVLVEARFAVEPEQYRHR